MTQSDSHDHATRVRETFESNQAANAANVVKQDGVDITIKSVIWADAGIIVPVATWGTTERVSTYMYSDFTSNIDVDGLMTRQNCEATNCNGKGACKCAPAFKLTIQQNVGHLTVDGTSYPVHRPGAGGEWKLG